MGHMDAKGLWPARVISHPHIFVLARTGIFASMLATLPPRPRRPQAHGVADTPFCSSFLQPRLCFAEGSHPSSQLRVAAVRRECSCRSRSLPPPMIATCRALQAKCHREHGNAVWDWDRGHSRERITLGGEEAGDSCLTNAAAAGLVAHCRCGPLPRSFEPSSYASSLKLQPHSLNLRCMVAIGLATGVRRGARAFRP